MAGCAGMIRLLKVATGVLLVTLVASTAVQAAPSIEKLQDYRSTLQQKLQQTRQRTQQLRRRESAARSQLSTTRQSLTATTDRLQDTRFRLDVARQRLVFLNRDLDELQREYTAQRRATVERLRFLQQQRPEQWWALLLMSRDLNRMLDLRYQMARVFERDQQMLLDLEEQRRKVVRKRLAVEDQKNDISLLTEQLTARQSRFKEQAGVQASLVQRISSERQAYEAAERRIAQDSRRLSGLIRALIASQQSRFNHVTGTGQMALPATGRLSSRFGMRFHPIFHVWRMHTGLDIAARAGTQIRAADDGMVIFAGWYGGYGRCAIISHGGNLATLYGHTSRLDVTVGQPVKKGQAIGAVGSTGFATGPHLHFEVRVNGSPVDPLGYLR